MRLATTLILLAAVLALAGYVKFFETAQPTTGEIRSRAGSLTLFDPSEIRSITVRTPSGIIALRLGEKGIWNIAEPYADRADPTWVENLLSITKNLQIIETIEASEIGDSLSLEDTGLGDGRFDLDLTPEHGDPIHIIAGRPSPIKGTTYVQSTSGKKDIHVVSGDLHPLLSRPLSELRDRRLIRLNSASLTGFSLKNAGGEIELERDGDDAFWMLTRPLQTRGHREYVDDILALLTNAEISGLASEGNGTDSRAFEPDQTTVVTLKSGTPDSPPLTLEIAQPTAAEPLKTLARVSDRSHIFKVDSELISLLNRSPNDFRDDYLANIDPEAVSAISITDLKGYRSMIRRRGNLWVLERNGTFEGANYNAIADLFKTLNDERVIDFAADSAANLATYGLDRPYLRILLAGHDSPNPPEPEPGAATPESSADQPEREIVDLRIGINREDGKLYANFLGEPFIYRIGDVILGAAPADPLKWKALNILRFGYTNLKNLRVARGSEPPISISSNFNLQQFRAVSGDKDVTDILNKRRLTDLALTLSGLRAENWVTDKPDEIPELQNPSLNLKLTIDHPLPEGGTETFLVDLSFAPTIAGRRTAYFYGKLASGPEVFLIPYATYRTLAASLISDPTRPLSPDDPDDGLSNPVRTTPTSPDPPQPTPQDPSPPQDPLPPR